MKAILFNAGRFIFVYPDNQIVMQQYGIIIIELIGVWLFEVFFRLLRIPSSLYNIQKCNSAGCLSLKHYIALVAMSKFLRGAEFKFIYVNQLWLTKTKYYKRTRFPSSPTKKFSIKSSCRSIDFSLYWINYTLLQKKIMLYNRGVSFKGICILYILAKYWVFSWIGKLLKRLATVTIVSNKVDFCNVLVCCEIISAIRCCTTMYHMKFLDNLFNLGIILNIIINTIHSC